MKTLIIFLLSLLFILPPSVQAGENNPSLQFPRKVSFGKCPYGSSTTRINYSKIISFTNTSDENIYLVDGFAEKDYDDKYTSHGFIFYFYGIPSISYPPSVIPPKQSLEWSVWFYSYDTLDSNDVEFRTKAIFRSRTDSHFPYLWSELYLDTLEISAIATKSSPGVLAGSLDYHGGYGCPDYFAKRNQTKYYAGFFNNLPESIILDSLVSEVNVAGILTPAIPVDPTLTNEISLPATFLPQSSAVVLFSYKPLLFQENKVKITGYFTGKDSKQNYIATSHFSFKDSLLPEGRFFLYQNYYESKDGTQQLDKQSVYLNGCANSPLWADSIVFTPAWSKDELKVVSGVITFPFLMDPSEEYRLDLLYTPKERGRKFGFAKGYFHSTDGKPIVRTLDFQTYYAEKTGVEENPDIQMLNPSLLITEPYFPMKLLGNYIGSPKLYDSFGNSIDISMRLEQNVISLEGLSSGMYCFIVQTNKGIMSKKILYVK